MLNELNRFVDIGGVRVVEDAAEFEYSDGLAVENYLKSVMENASDLSSHSAELENGIEDWASEYHLSSKRANLLRAFDLSGFQSALELGCGCGAITRYLGEAGLRVDAVEGSPGRAAMASLRCRDLDNVNVFSGNFNDIRLPKRQYDLVCLIGVVEYAARFTSDPSAKSDPAAALIERIKPALAPGGILLIAIENRTGMKYVMGANEDHYARRFVGIHDYFGVKDINTYTRSEWEGIFRRSGVTNKRVLLPFPDYKLPTVVLSEEFTTDNPSAFCNLEGIESRDYIDLFVPAVRESLLWQSASASNSVSAFSNSFLFALSFDDDDRTSRFGIDFAHLPGFQRRREYCLITVKRPSNDSVERRKLVPETLDSEVVEQRVRDEPYHDGLLLSVQWSRAAEIEPDSGRFIDLVKEYLAYLRECRRISIDLTPFNIIVDGDGSYHAFDEEWWIKEPVSCGYLLFRSLLMLVSSSGLSLRDYARSRSLTTTRDLILYVGNAVGLDLEPQLENYIDMEERFQGAIQLNRKGGGTERLMQRSLTEDERISAPVKLRVYWKSGGEDYSEERTRQAMVEAADEVQSVALHLPPGAGQARRFRFNPGELLREDGVGFMRLYRMEISAIDPASHEKRSVWRLSTPPEIQRYTRMRGVELQESSLGSVFMITADDPSIEFDFIPREKLTGDEYIELEIEMRLPRSAEYVLARDRYMLAADVLQEKQAALDRVHTTYRRVETELDEIKASHFWQLFVRYRNLRKRLKPFTDKWTLWRSMLGNLGWRRTLGRAGRMLGKRGAAMLAETPEVAGPPTRYEVWRDKHLRRDTIEVRDGPLISVIMPVHNAGRRVLEKAVESVLRQGYDDWELCIADDASDDQETRRVLAGIKDKRVKLRTLDTNLNISGATNAAAELADGEYLAFMDNDDELMENALAEVARAIHETRADFIYTDEDFIRTDNHLDYPHFKSDYNPDLLLSHNYITHLLVLKRSLFESVGGLRPEFDGAQDYDLVLRAVEKAQRIHHIPVPVYHWRMSEQSTSLNPTIKPQGHGNARKALGSALRRRSIKAVVEETALPHYFRVRREIRGDPLVSVIIPFRDKPRMLARCVDTLLGLTTYANFEVTGISNDSLSSVTFDEMHRLRKLDGRIRFAELNEEFNFSRLVNYGVDNAAGEHVVLLNNDIELLSPEWIEALVEHSQREEIAAVGAKLYYPDNRIQHAGIAIGLGGYAGHLHSRLRGDSPGYFNRLNVIQNVTAVTGALMMVEKSKYRAIGGFDECRFGVAYNDVDFCLRAQGSGYRNLFTPYVEAIHHESVSRGYEETREKQARFEKEKANLRERHSELFSRPDQYYNPNFDQERDDFSFTV